MDQGEISGEVCIPAHQVLGLPYQGGFQQFIIAWVTTESQATGGGNNVGSRLDQDQIEERL